MAKKPKNSLLRGGALFYLGLMMVSTEEIPAMIFGAVLIGLGAVQLIGSITGKKASEEKKSVVRTPVTKVKKTVPRTDCPPSCAGEPRPEPKTRREKDLEQLESLYSAGLYDKQEYIQKRRKILSGQ